MSKLVVCEGCGSALYLTEWDLSECQRCGSVYDWYGERRGIRAGMEAVKEAAKVAEAERQGVAVGSSVRYVCGQYTYSRYLRERSWAVWDTLQHCWADTPCRDREYKAKNDARKLNEQDQIF